MSTEARRSRDSSPDPELRRLDVQALLRIDRAVERFEKAWREGNPMTLEAILDGTTGAERSELLRYALAVELTYRRRRGEAPLAAEFEPRFPDDVAVIRRALAEEMTASFSSEGSSDRFFQLVNEPAPEPGQESLPESIGKYLVLGRLGGGGQGAALLARDPDCGHLVVLKRYHTSAHASGAEAAARDGKALVRLRSRYVPQCYGLERHGDELILVMEYIPGRSLSEILESGPIARGEAVRLIEQVAEGLEAVHASGLIHRDIKPANIVRGDDGVPRLVDFGLAAHLGSEALEHLSGTPPYMAPEQAREQWERIDARTDIFSLGAVLYRLLTGSAPYSGHNANVILEQARRCEYDAPRKRNPKVPRALERICLKAMAPDLAQRYASAAELRQTLRRYRNRHWRHAAVGLACGLVLALVAWSLWPARHPGSIPGPPIPAPAPIALTGELTVRVWSPHGGAKRGWSVRDPGALPVHRGDQVHLEARLSRPAYAYLLWLDGQGQVASLYPWRDRAFGSRPAAEPAVATLESPAELDQGWPMEGPSGLETALLLVRPTPLPANLDLSAQIGRLPPTPVFDPREVAVLGWDLDHPVVALHRGEHRSRGLGAASERIDEPLLQVMERLRPHFEVIRAVRFAYQGE